MKCTNCGKEQKAVGTVGTVGAAVGLAAILALEYYTRIPSIIANLLDGSDRQSASSARESASNVGKTIDSKEGLLYYCSERCRDADLRRCEYCRRYFSLKRMPTLKPGDRTLCPTCLTRIEEADQVYQSTYQGLIASLRSNTEERLLLLIERDTQDPIPYLNLASYYTELGEQWHQTLKTLILHRPSTPMWTFMLAQEKMSLSTRIDPRERKAQAYHKAIDTAFQLARAHSHRAIVDGPSPLEEAKAHEYIARASWFRDEAIAPYKAALKAVKRHLRTKPQDIEGLELLVRVYAALGQDSRRYDAQTELLKARALATASSSRPSVESRQEQLSGPTDGIAFEEKCLRVLEKMGFEVSSTSTTNDGGIDLIAYRSGPILGGRYVIQCKDWSGKVGVGVVRELYGVATAEGANKGVLITSSTYTQGAIEFARGKPLELIDGEQLARLESGHP